MSDHVPDIEALKELRLLATGKGHLGPKIAAIKLYRQITGCSLMEGKAIVEDWIDFEPSSAKAEPETPTVRARIAVAVDDDGEWTAAGWAGANDSDLARSAWDGITRPIGIRWITAYLPIPQAVEVEGEVEDENV